MIIWVLKWFRRRRPELKDETPLARMARLNISQTTVRVGKK